MTNSTSTAINDWDWDRNDCDGFAGSPAGDAFVYDLLAWPVRCVVRLARRVKNGSTPSR